MTFNLTIRCIYNFKNAFFCFNLIFRSIQTSLLNLRIYFSLQCHSLVHQQACHSFY